MASWTPTEDHLYDPLLYPPTKAYKASNPVRCDVQRPENGERVLSPSFEVVECLPGFIMPDRLYHGFLELLSRFICSPSKSVAQSSSFGDTTTAMTPFLAGIYAHRQVFVFMYRERLNMNRFAHFRRMVHPVQPDAYRVCLHRHCKRETLNQFCQCYSRCCSNASCLVTETSSFALSSTWLGCIVLVAILCTCVFPRGSDVLDGRCFQSSPLRCAFVSINTPVPFFTLNVMSMPTVWSGSFRSRLHKNSGDKQHYRDCEGRERLIC